MLRFRCSRREGVSLTPGYGVQSLFSSHCRTSQARTQSAYGRQLKLALSHVQSQSTRLKHQYMNAKWAEKFQSKFLGVIRYNTCLYQAKGRKKHGHFQRAHSDRTLLPCLQHTLGQGCNNRSIYEKLAAEHCRDCV